MIEPIRVLQIVPNMQAGGLETLIMNLYRNIDRNKVQFDFLVHYQGDYFYDNEIRELGGNIYKLSFREDNDLIKYIKDLNDFFSTHDYKIVHCHMGSTAFLTLGTAKKHGVDYRILHSHNASTDSTLKGYLKSILLKFSKKYANKYFACGTDAGKFLYGHNDFEIIHNAIDVNKFAYAERKDDPLLNTLKDYFVIGHVGRFNVQKNHCFLIEIFAKYKMNNKRTKLLLIGDGELKEIVKKKAIELGIENDVIFYGTSSEMEKIYKCMDVFALPSLFEGLPVVGIESQAAGIPCLFSDKITNEVAISDLVKFIPIDQGVNPWVNSLNQLNKLRFSNQINTNKELLERKGYDIKIEALRVQKIYESYSNSSEGKK